MSRFFRLLCGFIASCILCLQYTSIQTDETFGKSCNQLEGCQILDREIKQLRKIDKIEQLIKDAIPIKRGNLSFNRDVGRFCLFVSFVCFLCLFVSLFDCLCFVLFLMLFLLCVLFCFVSFCFVSFRFLITYNHV